MQRDRKELLLRDGRKAVIRSAQPEDAQTLIRYLKKTAGETPYLVREPEEITLTLEQEREWIQRQTDAQKELMLVAELEGRHAGNCSLTTAGNRMRYAHRCYVAIALYQEFCGLGLGQGMLEEILSIAKEYGYEQAELEVVTTNVPAVSLYKKLGFCICGTLPHNMKYKDGSYADIYVMVKKL